MRSTAFHPLSLSEYEISPEQGFLPQDPCENLPDCPTLNQLGHELPKLLSARTVRHFIDEHRTLLPSVPPTWRDQDYRAAMRILSFAGHAYVWEVPDEPVGTLPLQLARPWYDVAQHLGRPPVLPMGPMPSTTGDDLIWPSQSNSTTLCYCRISSAGRMKNGLLWFMLRSNERQGRGLRDSSGL